MGWSACGSLRARLIGLVILAGMPALILAIYSNIEQREIAAAAAAGRAETIAHLTLADHERVVDGARALLLTLAQLPEVRNGPAGPGGSATPLLSKLLASYPLYANFGITNERGMLVCSGVPLTQPVDLSDRPWHERARQTGRLSLGDYQIGRVTAKPSVIFAQPLLKDDGTFAGTVYAAIDLTWLNELAARAQLPAGSVVLAVDPQGTVLTHHPRPQDWVGRSVAGTTLFGAMQGAKDEARAELVGPDGVQRLYVLSSLSPEPNSRPDAPRAYLAVGIPSESLAAAANAELRRSLLIIAAVMALAIAAVWFGAEMVLVRPVRALIRATERLAGGDLSARAGPVASGELLRLATAFDGMAASLDQAMTAVRQSNELLEQRVQERTEKLTRAMADLEESHRQRLAAQMQLIQAEKMQMVGRLAAGVAHEVKNPLSIIGMGLDYLAGQGDRADPTTTSMVLRECTAAVQRANTVILGLLDFSAPGQLKLTPTDLHALIEHALLLLGHEVRKHQISVEKDLAPDLPPLPLDGNKIEQVLVNLFMNSIQAMAGGGTLTVRTRRAGEGGGILVEIEDTGAGIPPEAAHRIFEPFFTTKPTGKGTGLGLTVSKAIIDLHGGEITIGNRSDGGARASLRLGASGGVCHDTAEDPAHRR